MVATLCPSALVPLGVQIAVQLREGREIQPESLDCITVFFSDICG